jgi:hypothetical protein
LGNEKKDSIFLMANFAKEKNTGGGRSFWAHDVL